MTTGATSCPREPEVLDLVLVRRWPESADPDLVAHVDACSVCQDAAAVARALADVHDEPLPVLPDAAVVWFRAQTRARAEAARRASLPVLLAQVATLSVLVVGFALAALTLSASLSGPAVSVWAHVAPGSRALVARVATLAASPVTAWADASQPWRWILAACALGWMLALPAALLLSRWADRSADPRLH